MKHLKILLFALGTAALSIVQSFGAANLIVNPSFESGPGGSLSVIAGSTALTGWTINSGAVDSAQGFQTHSGILCVDLDGFSVTGVMSQNVNVSVGQMYLLSFWMAGNADSGPAIKQMQVNWGSSSLGTFTFDITGHSISDMGWTEHQAFVLATSPTMNLKFTSLDAPGTSYGPMLDDVSVMLVPEPQSLTLCGFLFGAGGYWRWRRAARRQP